MQKKKHWHCCPSLQVQSFEVRQFCFLVPFTGECYLADRGLKKFVLLQVWYQGHSHSTKLTESFQYVKGLTHVIHFKKERTCFWPFLKLWATHRTTFS